MLPKLRAPKQAPAWSPDDARLMAQIVCDSDPDRRAAWRDLVKRVWPAYPSSWLDRVWLAYQFDYLSIKHSYAPKGEEEQVKLRDLFIKHRFSSAVEELKKEPPPLELKVPEPEPFVPEPEPLKDERLGEKQVEIEVPLPAKEEEKLPELTSPPVPVPVVQISPTPPQVLARARSSVKRLTLEQIKRARTYDVPITSQYVEMIEARREYVRREETVAAGRTLYCDMIRRVFAFTPHPYDFNPYIQSVINTRVQYQWRVDNRVCEAPLGDYMRDKDAWVRARANDIRRLLLEKRYDWSVELLYQIFPGISQETYIIEHCEAVNQIWERVRPDFLLAADIT